MSISPGRYVEVSANGSPPDLQAQADIAAATAAGAIAGAEAGRAAAPEAEAAAQRAEIAAGQATGEAAASQAAALVAEGARDTATAAAISADLDSAATAADRLQTGLDRAATTADAAQTAADRVQTGLDRVATGADRVQTGLDRAATAADRVQTGIDASTAAAEAAVAVAAAIAGGAPLLTTMPVAPFTGVASPFMLLVEAGIQVFTHDTATATFAGWVGDVSFPTVATLLASTATTLGPVGTTVNGGRFRYRVVSSGEHVTTAGGVKLIVLPDATGLAAEAFGVDLTGVASANAILAIVDAAAVAAGVPWYGSPGTVSLTASITHAAPVKPNGMLFSFGGGVVQTFAAPFYAGREEVFVGTLNLTSGPRWSAGDADAIYPEWFGARAIASSGGTAFDSAPAIQNALFAASRSFIGFVYTISFGCGIYYIASTLLKQPGLVCFRGQDAGSSQLRGMNAGGGYPDALFDFQNGTFGMRFEKLMLYGGSSSRPMKYGVTSTKLAHTNFDEVRLSGFSIAGIASYEWDNAFTNMEIDSCNCGIWLSRPGGNNNDITIDTVRFVSCDVPLVINAGTSVRVLNCQFQATIGATGPYTKTFIWSQGVAGFSLDNNYFETQTTGGLAGVPITVPTSLQLYAAVVFNHAPYFTDTAGAVTTTLSQSSSNLGTVGSVTDNLFATPAYWLAGAGGSGYSNGAVTFTAVTGTGTGATGTCTTTTGGIISIITVSSGGTGFMIGDIVQIVQGGNSTAVATVATTGANNSITGLYIGHAAALYLGNVRRLFISGNTFPASGAALALYNDRSICNPRKLEFRQNVTGGLFRQMIGPAVQTVDARFGDMTINDALYDLAPASGLGQQNYAPTSWAFAATPTASLFTRNSGRYKGYPWYRLKLLAGEQVSDTLEFSFLIASSGSFNSEMTGRTVYMSALKAEGQANTKLRLSLELTNGSNTLVRQNYDDSTSFTKSASEGREEVSLTVGTVGGTIRGKIQVIAASAAEQHVDFGGLILTIAGQSVDLFSIASFERPLTGAVSWTPGAISAGNTATVTLPCLGARAGDLAVVSDSATDMSDLLVTRKCVTNGVEVRARNVSATTKGGWTETMRFRVYPST